MAQKIETILNYLVITNTVTGKTTAEFPRSRIRYKNTGNNIDLVYVDDHSQDITFQFSELVDSTGTAFTNLAALLKFLREATGTDGSLVIEQSSISPATDVEGLGTGTVGTTAVIIAITGQTRAILISAGDTNLGRIYIGKSTVTSAGANALTFLGAGESMEIIYNDASVPLYVVGSIAAQEVLIGAVLN